MKIKTIVTRKTTFTHHVLFFLCLWFISNLNILSQTPLAGPGVQWSETHWLNMETISKDDSGEDWYYDLKANYNDETVIGYIGAGFSSQVYSSTLMPADFSPFNCYGCGQTTLDTADLEHIDYAAGGGGAIYAKRLPFP